MDNNTVNKEILEEKLKELKGWEEKYNDLLSNAANEGRIGSEHSVFYDKLADIYAEEEKLQQYLEHYSENNSAGQKR